MKIAAQYHKRMEGLKSPAHSPPELEDKSGVSGPFDVWHGAAGKLSSFTERRARGSEPLQDTIEPAKKMAPVGIDVLFQEDTGPRCYFQGFKQPGDLAGSPADFLATWESRVDIHPTTFFERLLDSERVALSGGDISVEGRGENMDWMAYNLKLSDPESRNPVGSMSREFTFDEEGVPQVYHGYFKLAEDRQGQGLGKELLAKSVELYDQIGVKSVSLFAALDVGGYAWAKYGFKPAAGKPTERLFNTLRSRLDRLDVPSGVKQSVKGLLAENKPEAIWAISDLNGLCVDQDEGPTTLGKSLLMGTNWQGTLDLTCPEARTRFDQYINRGGRDGSSKGV